MKKLLFRAQAWLVRRFSKEKPLPAQEPCWTSAAKEDKGLGARRPLGLTVRVRAHVTADQVGFFCSRPTAYFGLSTQKAEQLATLILERVKWVREEQARVTGKGRVRLG
jgi:hypothetical protein